MIARESPSLHPAPFYASGESSAKSNYSRTYEPFSRNSNYSRTYAIPGGGGIYQFLCQTNSSRSFYPDAALWIQVFAHSFIFWITAIPRPFRSLRTLPQKTGGTPPPGLLRGKTKGQSAVASPKIKGLSAVASAKEEGLPAVASAKEEGLPAVASAKEEGLPAVASAKAG